MLTQRHGDASLGELRHHRLAAGQLGGQRDYGHVVQASVDLHQVLRTSRAEGADKVLRVGSFLLGTDERTLQMATCRQSIKLYCVGAGKS